MAVDLKYLKTNLRNPELDTLAHILSSPKVSRIIASLCDKKGMYFNELQKKVGGSKTSTQQILIGLEQLKIVKSEWTVKEFKEKGQPGTRAVRSFKLKKDKEKLIEDFLPLIRKMSIFKKII